MSYYETMGVAWVRVDPTLLPSLRNHPLIDYIEPEQRFNLPSDVSTQNLIPGDFHHWGLKMVDAPSVWQAGYEGDGVKIMIMDSGVYRGQNGEGHEDLPLVPIANCSGSSLPGACNDYDHATSPWHGTRVLGVMAARKNGKGTVGVAPGIGRTTPGNIYMWKVCPQGVSCSTEAVIAGIDAASRYGVRVINMSFAVFPSATLGNAIAQAWSGGQIVMVAAAGNDNSTNFEIIGYPANYPNVVTVAAVNQDRTRYPTSNYGPSIDISAPACALTTTGNYNPQGLESPYGYGTYCSTSMATPYVSGVAALVIQRYPALTNAQVVQRLYDSARPAASANLGKGIVYAPGAVGESAEPPPSPCGRQIIC